MKIKEFDKEQLEMLLNDLKDIDKFTGFKDGAFKYELGKYQANLLVNCIKQYKEVIDKAINIAYEYGQIDGAHHKAWVIDQMVRELLGDNYKLWVEKYMFDGKDPVESVQIGNYYNWDIGVAP